MCRRFMSRTQNWKGRRLAVRNGNYINYRGTCVVATSVRRARARRRRRGVEKDGSAVRF